MADECKAEANASEQPVRSRYSDEIQEIRVGLDENEDTGVGHEDGDPGCQAADLK